MNKNTIKAVVAALALVVSGSVRPNAQASGGGVAQTKPITVNCCSTGGMTATSSGTCSCNVTASDTTTAGRARGDVVRLIGKFQGKLDMNKAGSVKVPEVGRVFEYQYGNITLVIGSFTLRGANPDVRSNKLQEIIKAAATKAGNADFNSLIWYGRKDGQKVVEIGETLTSASDLSNTYITYQPIDNSSFYFTTPSNAGGETYMVDLNPIKKQR